MPLRIGFVLLSNSRAPIPSTRVSVLNMEPFLRDAGFTTGVAYEPPGANATPDLSGLDADELARRFDIVFFQKVHGPTVSGLARQLGQRGVRTVYGVCDWFDRPMCEAVDAIVVVTDFLGSLHPPEFQGKIHVVHDGIEHPEYSKSDWGHGKGSRMAPLKAVLVTSHTLERLPVLPYLPPWLDVTIIGHYPEQVSRLARLRAAAGRLRDQPNWRQREDYLRFALNPRIHCKQWHPTGVYDDLLRADVGIIPISPSKKIAIGLTIADWLVKSENRLTLKMATGLPVIATPIPSYEPVVEQGRNAYLARSSEEWMAFLEELRDPDKRRAIGEEGRTSVLRRYSQEEQGRKLISVLRGLH